MVTSASTPAEIAAFKVKVLERSIELLHIIEEDFEHRIDDIMANEGNVNEEEYDSQTQAFQSEANSRVSLLSDQLKFTSARKNELTRLKETVHQPFTHVRSGAVVITNNDNFFIGAAIGQFSVDEFDLVGISPKSPLFLMMKDKQVGHPFKFKDTAYVIKDIF